MTVLPFNAEAMNMAPRNIGDSTTETEGSYPLQTLRPDQEDQTTEQYIRAVEASGVLDFWDDPDEDVYSVSDGEPV